LPNTLLKKVIWLLFVTADMSELPVIEARLVPLLHYRAALMIQRWPAAAASAIMKVFASITGNAESRASLRLAPLGRSLSPVFADYIVDLIATHKPSKGDDQFRAGRL
jgi:hypothetical protein